MPQVQIPVHGSTGTPVARCEERIGSRTTMPMSERRPSTMNSFSPAEIPQTSMALQRRLQISELRFQLILHSIIIYVLEEKSQKPKKVLVSISLGCYVMDQRSGDGRFGG